jgi:hypothetical protein
MLPFSLCNKKRLAIQHMNRPLFPTTLSIPPYDIGKQVGLKTYQHPIVYRRCGAEEQSSAHVLCECGALASLRYAHLGSLSSTHRMLRVKFRGHLELQ